LIFDFGWGFQSRVDDQPGFVAEFAERLGEQAQIAVPKKPSLIYMKIGVEVNLQNFILLKQQYFYQDSSPGGKIINRRIYLGEAFLLKSSNFKTFYLADEIQDGN